MNIKIPVFGCLLFKQRETESYKYNSKLDGLLSGVKEERLRILRVLGNGGQRVDCSYKSSLTGMMSGQRFKR